MAPQLGSKTLLTYDLHAGADYARFREDLAKAFSGMKTTKLTTTVWWDTLFLNTSSLVEQLKAHKDVTDFIVISGEWVGFS